VTTWATFLPSFLFIFLTAPFLERLRGERRLSAALAAVTAAAVGVIANLAFVLGRAVFVSGGSLDVPAVALSAAALLALLRLRIDVPWLVLAGGLAGLVRAASGI
jgi:chromate transporter